MSLPVLLPTRDGRFGTKGKPVSVAVNAYRVESFPTVKIYQYDCQIGADATKRTLIQKLWNHPAVQSKFGSARNKVIFDGVRLAWSPVLLPFGEDCNILIDLDEGQRARKNGSDNKHRVVIRKTSAVVSMQVLDAYIRGVCDFDNEVLTGITFLDHLMRETPSKHFLAIKRSFFKRTGFRELPNGVEAWKGIFQSIRPAEGCKLIVNVDVSTAVFWAGGSLLDLACRVLKYDNIARLENDITGPGADKVIKNLRRLKKIGFVCHHRRRDVEDQKAGLKLRKYVVEGFIGSALDTKFEVHRTDDKGNDSIVTFSVNEYYMKTYNIRLKYPKLPLVRIRKRGEYYPMELCHVTEGQRYPFKLDDRQTADMIKFTVTRPAARMEHIKANVAELEWGKDPIHQAYGVKVDTQMIKTKARILPTPKIEFGLGSKQRTIAPQMGRWDLRNQKFIQGNPMPLKSWGIMVFNSPRAAAEQQVRNFVNTFIQIYTVHGGKVEDKNPPIMYADIRKVVSTNLFELFKKTGNRANMKPQILFFILNSKHIQPYHDIKAYCDIQIGVASQCLQTSHVLQAKPQYCTNVAMKVNAKLGGATNRLHGPDMIVSPENPTMVMGADVSHASFGHGDTSYASMVGSTDLYATRFAAVANTNGERTEIINTRNMETFSLMLLRTFKSQTTKVPTQILYFRDGVSEGEYSKVITEEIRDLKSVLQNLCASSGTKIPKITVVVCSKRHHFRFFPMDQAGKDANNNPVPGMVIERDITHPNQYDFFLNSHFALQGTARPVHYHVILDEIKWPVDRLQAMIYNTCYTYCRSTTSVSLVPATYYAHIASARARFHEPIKDDGFHVSTSGLRSTDVMPPPNVDDSQRSLKAVHGHLQTCMWFV